MSGDFSAFLNLTPLLSITRSASQVVVRWGIGVLHSTSNLPNGWQDVPNTQSLSALIPTNARQL